MPDLPGKPPRTTRALLLALQAALAYLTLAVVAGMLRETSTRAIEVASVAAFFAGLLVVAFVVPRYMRGPWLAGLHARRNLVAALLAVPAVASLVVGQGVLVGTWRGPSRLAGIQHLTLQFAGAWPLALVFFLIGALCLALALRVLKREAA